MTVADFIKKLEKMPQHLEVVALADEFLEYAVAEEPTEVEMVGHIEAYRRSPVWEDEGLFCGEESEIVERKRAVRIF